MGPEKRLPLALFTCFVVILGLQIFNMPKGGTKEDQQKIEEQKAAEEGTQDGSVAGAAAPGTTASTSGSPAGTLDAEPIPELPAWDKWVTFGSAGERGYMAVHFDSFGGSISEIRLGNYFTEVGFSDDEKEDRANWVKIVEPAVELERILLTGMIRLGPEASRKFRSNVSAVHWKPEVLAGDKGVQFTHVDPSGLILTKTFKSVPDEHQLTVDLSLGNTADDMVGAKFSLGMVASAGMGKETNDSAYPEPQAVAARLDDEPEISPVDAKARERFKTLVSAGDDGLDESIAYFGTFNKYFALLMRPVDEATRGSLKSADKVAVYDQAWAKLPENLADRDEGFLDIMVEGSLRMKVPAVGETTDRSFVLYAGPKDATAFGPGDEAFADILREDLGFFDGIATVILGYLRFLHGIVGNWGWAIIFLTITVRLMLFPLQRRMQTSMARHATKMRRVQPKIDAVKEKYKNDPQRLRQEQAKVFQSEGAMPPIGGCLPMFLQIPIFFGLFSALRVAFDLRHEPFIGWIKDLSQPDRLAEINFNTYLPIIGEIQYFNILPILMVVLWVGQQKVMPKPAAMNEQAAQMQKIMMWMPIMFGFFLYNYASGLSLYMITTSFFGIIESTVIRRVWPIDETEQPKKKSKLMAKLEAMQEQAIAMQEAQAKQRGAGGKGGQKGNPKGNQKGGGKKR